MPGEPFLIELDDDLRTLDVGLARGDQIGLVGALPLHQEHELTGGIRRANDALGLETAIEAAGSVVEKTKKREKKIMKNIQQYSVYKTSAKGSIENISTLENGQHKWCFS